MKGMLDVYLSQKCSWAHVKDEPDSSVYCYVWKTPQWLRDAIIHTIAWWLGQVNNQSQFVGCVVLWNHSETADVSSGKCKFWERANDTVLSNLFSFAMYSSTTLDVVGPLPSCSVQIWVKLRGYWSLIGSLVWCHWWRTWWGLCLGILTDKLPFVVVEWCSDTGCLKWNNGGGQYIGHVWHPSC